MSEGGKKTYPTREYLPGPLFVMEFIEWAWWYLCYCCDVRYNLFFFIAFFLLAAFAPAGPVDNRMPTSADDPGPPGSIHNLPRGCYVMKKRGAEEYQCFGCASGKCKDEDRNVWDYTGQDIAKAKGYSCTETTDGCVLE